MTRKIVFSVIFLLIFSLRPAKCLEPLRRGLFVSVIQEPPVLSSRQAITRLIAFAKKARIQIIFVQIYRANKAWFPSDIADSGPYKESFSNLSEDPLQFLITQAHASGIQVHAWLNMLSLSDNADARLLEKYGTGILTRNIKAKKELKDYKIDDQYFLEPGDARVRDELLNLVEEILRTYPELDGVQFDYVRYPDKHPAYGYTEANMERFKRATGLKDIEEDSRAWKDWKREQVTEFLRAMVERTRALRPRIQVSATGCMPYSRAYYEAFQDWPAWLKQGLVDFVTLMNYTPDPAEFERWNSVAEAKVSDLKRLNIGVGAYKLVRSPEVFEREFRSCLGSGAGACVIFHYGSLLENRALGNCLTDGN